MSILTTNPVLPRSLDVAVTVSRPQIETTADLSIVGAILRQNLTDPAPSWGKSEYARVYSSIQAVEADFPVNTAGRMMGQAFFSQSPRAGRLVIGRARTDQSSVELLSGTHNRESLLTIVNRNPNGVILTIQLNSTTVRIPANGEVDVSGVNVDADQDIGDIGTAIAALLDAAAPADTFTIGYDLTDNRFTFTEETNTGLASDTIGTVDTAGNTDWTELFRLNDDQGATRVGGSHSSEFTNELSCVAAAADALGAPIYAWTFSAGFYDVTTDVENRAIAQASRWVEARVGTLFAQDHDPLALQIGQETLGSYITGLNNESTVLIWTPFENRQEYSAVAMAAYALHVDYAAPNSTVTLKFKDFNGVTPANITETQLNALTQSRYNVLTRIGQRSRYVREGTAADLQYYVDEKLILDNFTEELQVAVLNVFLRERKVPYNATGVALIRSAIETICQQYVANGALSSRVVNDTSRQTGQRVDPPFIINSQELRLVTADQRQRRAGPPFTVQLNLAGAIHSVAINVEAFA